MEVHVLNGDALAEKFPLNGDRIICREALIEGPVKKDDLNRFWIDRTEFLSPENPDNYFNLVVHEFEKLRNANASTINLWFEHDLFCQVNLWFTIDFLCHSASSATLYLVAPLDNNDSTWSGFGNLSGEDLIGCYQKRIPITDSDREVAVTLWKAYRENNHSELLAISAYKSPCFQRLAEVCKAQVDRFPSVGPGRPHQKLKEIVDNGVNSFAEIFNEFRRTEGIYGFGDRQVKKLLSEISS